MKNLNRLSLLLLLAPVMFAFYGCKEDTVYGDWVKVSDFSGVTRSDATSFVIGTKGYVFAGYDGEDRLSDLWEYNSDRDDWTQMAAFPGVARNSASSFAIGNKGYVGLGFDGNDYLKDFWEFDVESNTWTRKADFLGSARNGSIAFGLKGKGYMGAGFDDNYLKDFYQYDPSSDTWQKIVDIQGSKRFNGTSFIYNDEAYVLGGINNGAVVTDFWKYNADSQSWIKLNYISDKTDESFDDDYTNLARQYPLVFVIGDKAYLTCGSNSSGSLLNDTWEYDFATDRWKTTSDFEGTTRTEAVAFSMGTRGFVLTGRSGSYRFDDVWEFLPDQEYDNKNN